MKVLITGGTGFIGNYLAKELKNKGHNTSVLTNDPKARECRGCLYDPLFSFGVW